MAAYRGMKELNLGVDNLAAVWAVMNRRSKIHHRTRATVVRRIQQTLRWSGMALRLTCVPSRWNPADSICRIFKWSSGLRAVIEARACSQVLRTLQWAPCSDMGTTSYESYAGHTSGHDIYIYHVCMTTSFNNQCIACNGVKVAWVELYMD